VGGPGQVRRANLDGVARGARIIVTDIASRGRCVTNALVEKGGNVDPGSLAVRLNELICANTSTPPSTGACANVVGGGNEVHLAITPFGAPDNFQTIQFLPSNGTYPTPALDIDRFLYNNRDMMVVAPVGNNGANIGSSGCASSPTCSTARRPMMTRTSRDRSRSRRHRRRRTSSRSGRAAPTASRSSG